MKKYVIDIEASGLVNPTHIWLVVMKDIDTGVYQYYRNVSKDREEYERLRRDIIQIISSPSDILIGHNLCGYDWPVLCTHLQLDTKSILLHGVDTLVISKLIDYSRKGHSIEDYGIEFGVEKGKFNDFTKYSKEMEDYCVRDVDICERIYSKYVRYVSNPLHASSIALEHAFQLVVNDLHSNGFCFNTTKAISLLDKVASELATIDEDISKAFPPKLKLIREITPKETKYGTLNKTDFRWLGSDADLSIYNGGPFCRCSWDDFNPSSHKQIVQVLHTAGWKPVDKTQTHIETERSLNQLKYKKGTAVDIQRKELYSKLVELQKTGWKVNESNLETLPPRAPKAASLLARRILLEARRRTLTEWLDLVQPDGRIRAQHFSIGTWTHRGSTHKPNVQNIPNEFDTAGKKKLLGKELRSLWCAPKNRLLVGCDAEAIQLRIFAHYINDPEFTKALVEGKKDDKTDPHSLNQTIIGDHCKSRAAAKRFIYALLLGAGLSKLSEILGCSEAEAKIALERLLERYSGWARLKEDVFPRDAKRGWFSGLDGRKVRIPGDGEGGRKHLAMSGYLQNGEAVCMKLATLKWINKLKEYDAKLVNFVHDEWQVETPNNMTTALLIAELMAQSLKTVGEDLKLNCPLAGSYWNDDIRDYTIATSWAFTH